MGLIITFIVFVIINLVLREFLDWSWSSSKRKLLFGVFAVLLIIAGVVHYNYDSVVSFVTDSCNSFIKDLLSIK